MLFRGIHGVRTCQRFLAAKLFLNAGPDKDHLPSAGVHGILPHYARQLSDAAASICKCLKQCLKAHSSSTGHLPHSNKCLKLTHTSSPSEQQQRQHNQRQPQQAGETGPGTTLPLQWQQEQANSADLQATEQQQQQQHAQASLQPMQRPSHSVGTMQQQCQPSTHELDRAEPTSGKSEGNLAAATGSQDNGRASEQLESPAEGQGLSGDLPSKGQDTVSPSEGRGDADGIWQVLAAVAVTHHEQLHEKLIEQCREEDMEEAAGLKLADRHDFEQLASMADFDASNLPLSGQLESP